eukprot:1331940-Amorphochlora_amoeboformis.AAC.1
MNKTRTRLEQQDQETELKPTHGPKQILWECHTVTRRHVTQLVQPQQVEYILPTKSDTEQTSIQRTWRDRARCLA